MRVNGGEVGRIYQCSLKTIKNCFKDLCCKRFVVYLVFGRSLSSSEMKFDICDSEHIREGTTSDVDLVLDVIHKGQCDIISCIL